MAKRAELKDHRRELYNYNVRLTVAGMFVVTLFCVLFARFVWLQVVKHEHYKTLAQKNRIAYVPIVPNRGLIVDRNGAILAQNYSAYTLEVTPSKIPDIEKTLDELSQVVEITARDRKRFKKLREESKSFESLPIRSRLNDEEVARFSVNQYRFPGVEVKARLFRHYPQGEQASHVVGYIGRISDTDREKLEEDEKLDANYKGSEYIGKTGLEYQYEAELHGTTGWEEVEIDSGGRAIRTLSRRPPINGNTLVLNLDMELQRIVELAYGEHRGALVAVDPKTGGVLAFVSKPGYDPNLFVDGIDPQNWDALNTSEDKPLTNRAIRGQYPPGSTFKTFMALAALELKLRTPEWSMPDPGFFTLPGVAHQWRDDKVGGHGMVDLPKSLVVSCDTYYYRLAVDMGIDRISGFLSKFGLGARTGVDIPGELTGVLPSAEWKRNRFSGKRFREEHRKWYVGDTVSIGIGQGYNLVTPMQMAHATAVLANYGTVFRPHVANHIIDMKTGEKRLIEPKPIANHAFTPENVRVVRDALVEVTRTGTAARAGQGATYLFAGKTGTAQVVAIKQGEKYDASKIHERHRDHALFTAFAPADDPKIALGLIVENAGFGAVAAAPIARQVLDYYLLGKRPSQPADIKGEPDGTH